MDFSHYKFITIRLIYTNNSPDLAERNTLADFWDTFSIYMTHEKQDLLENDLSVQN